MDCVTEQKTTIAEKAKPADPAKTPLFTRKAFFFCTIASAFYLLLSYFLIGYKADQLILIGIFNLCFFASRATRQFITGFSIFILYWIIFDYMKAFPNYRFNEVHIQSLYETEKALFGVSWQNTIVTPNEFLAAQATSAVDVLAGIFYLCWIPVPLTFAGILFFRHRRAFFEFSLTFFLVNIIGFIGYYFYPAAPPWYVAQYGFDFIAATPGHTAGLARFDSLFGISLFEGMYAKSSNVFAAMPSMHAAFMLIVLFYGLKYKLRGWNILFATIMVGIWFAAVYTSHHYILDVLAGIGCAITGIVLLQWWIKTSSGKRLINFFLHQTS